MTIGLAYWVIIIVLVLFFGAFWGGLLHPTYLGINNLVELALFILLGWAVFGPPLHRS